MKTLLLTLIPFLAQELGGTDITPPDFCWPTVPIPPDPLYPCLPPYVLDQECVERCKQQFINEVNNLRMDLCNLWEDSLQAFRDLMQIADKLEASCTTIQCFESVLNIRSSASSFLNSVRGQLNQSWQDGLADAEIRFQICLDMCCILEVDPPK